MSDNTVTINSLVTSCKDCKTVCCKTGPGPHRKKTPEEYLENFGTVEAYNTKCMALGEDNLCTLWGTPDFPVECRTYICQSRYFSHEELKTINQVDEDFECTNCGMQWVLGKFVGSDWIHECENCGMKVRWKKKIEKRGKKQ